MNFEQSKTDNIFKIMKKTILSLLSLTFFLIATSNIVAQNKQNMNTRKRAFLMVQEPKTLDEVKAYSLGEWQSISVELRPTEDRTGSGQIQSTYLKRHFTYITDDKFVGTITLFGDNYGQLPLLKFTFKGELKWGDQHPIADGAWNIDYILNEGFEVTPLHEQATMMLNAGLAEGMEPFETGKRKDILKQAFPMFNIVKDQIVVDYDLIYFKNGMLFMGAKHVDGTPFDKAENRPHQLQIPLEKLH